MSWWIVSIGDRTDEQLRDRIYTERGKRYIATYKLPERARYVIEDRQKPNCGMIAVQRALERAAAEGIVDPVCLGRSRTRCQIVGGRIVDL